MLQQAADHPAQGAAALVVVFGIALIALGLVPGPLARVKDEIRHFSDSLSRSSTLHSHHHARNNERLSGQIWWAVGGLALVALGLLALISN